MIQPPGNLMESDNIVRTVEVIGTALALTLALTIIVPGQEASANNHYTDTNQTENHPSVVDDYAVDL